MKFLRFTNLTAIFIFLFGQVKCVSTPLTGPNNNKIELCNQHLTLIRSAEELVDWKMYDHAIPAYTSVVQSLISTPTILSTNLIMRMAQIQLILGQPRRAIEILETIPIGQSEPQKKQLIALSMIHINQPEQAIKYLNGDCREDKILLAMAFDLMGRHEESTKYLKQISPEDDSYLFSRLLLTKMALRDGSYQQASEELKIIESRIPSSHTLYPEVLWLKGVSHYQLDNISLSIVYFEEALMDPSFQTHGSYSSCIEQLAHAYLIESDKPNHSLDEKARLLYRAEQMVHQELNRNPSDSLKINLAKVLLAKNFYFPSNQTIEQCKAILYEEKQLATKNAQREVLLLKAQIDKGYTQKEKYLSLLTSTKDKEKSSIVSDGWLLRGHNEKEEAYYGNRQDTRKHLELALSYYKKAYDLFNKTSTNKTHEALTCWAQTAKDLGEIHQMEQVYKVIEENILSRRPSFKTYYTRSLIGTHLYEMSGDHRYLSEGIDDLKQGLLINPSDKETIQASLLLGKIHFLKNNFDQAESVLAPLVDMFPDSPLAFETLYWAGRAAERQIKPNHSPGEYYRRCFNDYPSSSFAAEAFFRVYTYQDYLNSEKEAKKHLEELLTRYPDSRFVMDTNFLLALDSKRDRKTSKGKWISKSNVTKAIDQFHQVTTDYQRFQSLNLIDDKDLAHYSSLELRATLEKALCNLTIARQSSGAKKHIYLQYAKEVFTDLIDKMGPPQPNNFKHDTFEEAVYGLAQTELEAEQYDEAEQLIHKLIDTYEASKVTRGYYLSRSWHDLSLIALADETSERSYQQSLDYLQNAEECAKGRVLSTDETIDLWLKMSHCYKMLGQYDQAMRYLTKAIDEDAVSNLRLKAMYLRAEIYQLQGRLELSRKQLEATAKKGGEWGQKAKDKLGEIYEYH